MDKKCFIKLTSVVNVLKHVLLLHLCVSKKARVFPRGKYFQPSECNISTQSVESILGVAHSRVLLPYSHTSGLAEKCFEDQIL